MECQTCGIEFGEEERIVSIIISNISEEVPQNIGSHNGFSLHLECYHEMIAAAQRGFVATRVRQEPRTDGPIRHEVAAPVEEKKDEMHSNSSFERNNILSFLD